MGALQQQPGSLPQGDRPTVSVVLVNYQSWPDIDRLVRTLTREPEYLAGHLQVIVVDNASPDPVPRHLLCSSARGVQLVLRSENGGFAVGVNAGWRCARSPWLLVLNPDVEIGRGLIGQVIERIHVWSEQPAGPPGIVGFGLKNPDGSIQGSVGIFPSLARTLREQFIPRPRRKYQAGWRIRPGVVDWVTGACMLLNGRMMADLGGMDEDFFLYHEEVALCRVARDRGWRVEYDPTLQVIHRHPLQNRAISPKMRVILRHSKLLYFRKHLPGWQSLGLSWLISMEAMVRGMVARLRNDGPQARAWSTIAKVARRLRAGETVRGREILALAESVQQEGEPRSRWKGSPHVDPDVHEHSDRGGRRLAAPPGSAEEWPR